MNFDFNFTLQELSIAIIGIMLLVIAIIVIGRLMLKKSSQHNLASKYEDKVWDSPLKGRNKYPDVDVFQYSNQFFLLALILTLSVVAFAFNWTSYEKEVIIPDNALELEEDIEIEPPRSAEPPPPPPPPPPPVITEVPNDEFEEEDDIEFLDQSVEEETVVEAPPVAESTKEAALPPPPPPPPPPEETEIEEIFQVVEQMPRFPGCEDLPDKKAKEACANKKMLEFLYTNLRYPPIARENGIEGTVVVRFVVNKKGMIDQPEVVRDIGGQCGEEALRVVNLMNSQGERWIPGKQRGMPVNVYFNLPVKFKLL